MEKKNYKERLNYVRDNSLGHEVLIGSMANTPGVFQADDEEDLKKMGLSFGKMWLEFMGQELSVDEPFELKELTVEEWEAKDDNIDYWEIERIKRLLKRPTINAKFIDLINQAISDSDGSSLATTIMNKLINQPNK